MGRRKKIEIKRWKIVVSIIVLCLLVLFHIFADKLEKLVGYDTNFASNQSTANLVEGSDYYVSYIDVGQGNSSFVKLPDGKTLLIDGGDKEFGETVAEFLSDRNITQIDYMIATHADSDHIGGLNYVLENFEIKQIYRPLQISMNSASEVYEYEDLKESYEYMQTIYGENPKVCKVTTSVYKEFIRKIYDETYTLQGDVLESKICVFYDGLKISGENYEIEFFGPLRRDEEIDFSDYSTETDGFATIGYGSSNTFSNDSSAIFTITCFDDKYLFMGDSRFTEGDLSDRDYSEWDFIQSLTNSEKAELSEVDVLLLPHHGSKYSASDELLELTLPRFVVVSAGAGNTYNHPHSEVLDRLEGLHSLESDYLLRTDTMGDISFSSINSKLSYCTEKQGTEEKLTISFRVLCVIIAFSIIMLVFSIRPRKRTKSRS